MAQQSHRHFINPKFFFNAFFLLNRSVRHSILVLLVLSVVIQLIYLWALPISYEGDASVYYRYARWMGRLEPWPFVFWVRPPVYPLYLNIFGLTWADSFNGVIAANAVLGVSMPLLLYGALYPLGKRWAFGAALAYALSTLPFSYAKVFITEQLYSFFVVLLAFAVSRFFVTQKNGYAWLTAGAAFAALMTRNEAVYLAISAVLLELSYVVWHRNRRATAAVVLSALVVLGMTLTWSQTRAWLLGQPELFGSLHNFSGWQLFDRIYLSGISGRWGDAPDLQRAIFIQAKNGPASAKVESMFPGLLEKPSQENFGTIVMGIMAWADGGANTPGLHKGIEYTDRLLRAMIAETIIAHPEILRLMAVNALQFLGVRLPGNTMWPPAIFWGPFDTYQAMPHDIGEQASTSMPKRLFEKYTDSYWQRPAWLLVFRQVGQDMHNLLRTAVGVVLFLTIWFLPLSRHRLFAAFAFVSAGIMIGAGTAGFGYNGRYEHAIMPYLLMVATLSAHACATWVRSLLVRVPEDRTG